MEDSGRAFKILSFTEDDISVKSLKLKSFQACSNRISRKNYQDQLNKLFKHCKFLKSLFYFMKISIST